MRSTSGDGDAPRIPHKELVDSTTSGELAQGEGSGQRRFLHVLGPGPITGARPEPL